MVTKKVCTVLLVDVSPSMREHLGSVGDNLSRIVQNKILHSKIDEFALVLCGSDETKNDLHTKEKEMEAEKENGSYDEFYLNVDVKVPMGCSTLASADHIAALSSMAGAAPADYLDGITVAGTMLIEHARGGTFVRRIIFVTDLRTPCELDEDGEEMLLGIGKAMRSSNVQLTVAVVGQEGSDDDDESIRATVAANRIMLSRLCAILNAPGVDDKGAIVFVAASALSRVDDASHVLLIAQIKQSKPTTTFRGPLELTPWLSLRVWVYKKISELKPPSMKKGNEAGGPGLEEIAFHKTYTSFEDPDRGLEVNPEMITSAWPYGSANIPIQEDVRKMMASKNEKGIRIVGFTPVDTVPHWFGMEEARVLVPFPTKNVSAAAGLAESAGISCHSTRGMGTCPLEREAGKASAAMSALAKAMLHTGTAALTRAVWSQNSDKVSFGALTPHITPEGDFLIFTPMPYSEDMYSSDFKPLPVTGSASATQLAPALAARLVPTQDQRAAAAALVDALDGAGPEPWRCLNPALARTHALLHARAVDESALPLAPPSGGGPEAAAALLAPPLSSFARHTLLGGGSRGRGGCSGDGVGGGGAMVPAAATTAARAFQAACGGLRLAEAKGGGRKRGREDATAAAEALPGREGGLGAHAEPVRGRDPEAHPQQRRTDSGGGDAERMAAAAAAAAKNGVSAGGSGGEGGDADNAWVHVVKDEPGDEDDEGPHTEMHERVSEMPPPIEDDGFFDDME